MPAARSHPGTRDVHALRSERRVVLTLDAGGTLLRFNALRGGEPLLDGLELPSLGHDLGACLAQLERGFAAVHEATGGEAAAISFGFPGPADYAGGVVGDLPNLTGFRGGVALGPMLQARFALPVYLNNDGALFTLGEALGGLLPWVNAGLARAGSARRFSHLLGFTFGTGFGGGLALDGRLIRGDNGAAGQVWMLRHRDLRQSFAEEGVSIRAVRRAYAAAAGLPLERTPSPRDIAAIARGELPGVAPAARLAWAALGRVAGDAIAGAVALVDGLVVLGGGLSAACDLFLPALMDELNGGLTPGDALPIPRLPARAVDLQGPAGLEALVQAAPVAVPVPGTDRTATYAREKLTGVGLTRLGTSEAIALGAYAFALDALDAGEHAPKRGSPRRRA